MKKLLISFSLILFGMVIVYGEAYADVHVVAEPEGKIDVAGKRAVNAPAPEPVPGLELPSPPPAVCKLARAAIAPVVRGNGSAHSGTEMEDADSVRVLLV